MDHKINLTKAQAPVCTISVWKILLMNRVIIRTRIPAASSFIKDDD